MAPALRYYKATDIEKAKMRQREQESFCGVVVVVDPNHEVICKHYSITPHPQIKLNSTTSTEERPLETSRAQSRSPALWD